MASETQTNRRRVRRRPAGSGATIYDVAAHAGVSTATVSRTLRSTTRVAPDTRRRVLTAVEELRFVPSRLGRGLAERRHAANGIVFPHLTGPYYAELVVGYEVAAGELGRSVLILSTEGRRDARELVLDLAARVDGLVVVANAIPDPLLTEVAATGVPMVVVAGPSGLGVPALTTENVTSARLLARHLLGHGYQRFAYLGDPAVAHDVAARWRTTRETLAAEGIEPRYVACPRLDEQAGRQAADELLSAPQPPQAVVCANDELALGVLSAAERLGLRVPADVAVTGWDDVMAARYVRPALTTVRQPARQLGERAARALESAISGGAPTLTDEVLPTELVVRATCGDHSKEETR